MRKFTLGIMAALLTACGGGASSETANEAVRSGAWDLKAKQSVISYMTIKNNNIAENNSFSLFSGSVSPSGDISIDITLNSVQTNIDTRDARMKKFVFKTEQFPSAVITSNLPLAELDALAVGGRTALTHEINVSLAGVSQSYDANFMVTRLGPNAALVETTEPVLVSAEDFGLGAGVAKLQELAKLNAITPVVPVSVSLVFKR